ncbi:MAG: SDR family NAD(P)-dependent oxidoreductase [Bacteroidales bacterium]
MKNYLVVGASSGIGNQITRLLSEMGHHVWGTYYKNQPNESMEGVKWLQWLADEPFDATSLPEILHGLVYCVGAIPLKSFQSTTERDFIDDFSVQVVGATRVLRATLSRLKAAEKASVVLFSTVAVQTGIPFHSVVSASKGAIEGLTRSLAAEWAPRIRVNAIAPSLTDTPLASRLLAGDEKRKAAAERHPLRRVGTALDQAQAAVFLLTDASSWITGQILHVDGGFSNLKV